MGVEEILLKIRNRMERGKLTNSQKKAVLQMKRLLDSSQRKLFILSGKPGTGKTFIVKQVIKTEWHDAKYFNLAESYFPEIFKEEQTPYISSKEFKTFIKTLASKYNSGVIIDGLDPIINILHETGQFRGALRTISRWAPQKQIVLVFSVLNEKDINQNILSEKELRKVWGEERLVVVDFNNEDMKFLANELGLKPNDRATTIYDLINKRLIEVGE